MSLLPVFLPVFLQHNTSLIQQKYGTNAQFSPIGAQAAVEWIDPDIRRYRETKARCQSARARLLWNPLWNADSKRLVFVGDTQNGLFSEVNKPLRVSASCCEWHRVEIGL